MKRYIWTAIVLVFVGANASDNPFDLNKNLKKIDKDQNILLSELKAIAVAKEKREEAEAEEEDELTEVNSSTNVSEKKETVVPKITEEERLQKIKEEQAQIEAQRAQKEKEEQEKVKKAEAQKAQAEKARLEAEKREVAKYEAQRAEKKKHEAEDLAQAEEEKAKLEVEKEEVKHQNISEKKETAQSTITDINIAQEETEAAKEADKAYKEAVSEVD
ncbi:MAG: hypothetical protein P794_01965 [Epsilonproteobacteria bacterium (ex Lamellibrachia satsuma)]|nr:MAG: hypothetical protein P794_01965 [Epsilonproteobacteria bacterium (ex Lamellibrachia satsuma)]